jgi:hypothetical protein
MSIDMVYYLHTVIIMLDFSPLQVNKSYYIVVSGMHIIIQNQEDLWALCEVCGQSSALKGAQYLSKQCQWIPISHHPRQGNPAYIFVRNKKKYIYI